MHERVLRGRVGEGHDRGQGLDVHEHVLGCVGRGRGGLGDHHGYRLAGEAHDVAGQHRSAHPLLDHGDRGKVGQVEVGCGEHPEHAGLGPCLVRVHVQDATVGHGGTHEAGSGLALEAQVGHIAATLGEHPLVLGAKDAVAQDAHA